MIKRHMINSLHFWFKTSIITTGEDTTMDSGGVDHCLFLNNCDNYDDVRGVVSARNDMGSINSYMPLEVSDVPYCDQVGEENDMDINDKHVDESYSVSSLGTQVNVECATPKSQVSQTSQVASVNPSSSQQCISNEDTPSN